MDFFSGLLLISLFALVLVACINYLFVVRPRKRLERIALGHEAAPRHRKIGRHAA